MNAPLLAPSVIHLDWQFVVFVSLLVILLFLGGVAKYWVQR